MLRQVSETDGTSLSIEGPVVSAFYEDVASRSSGPRSPTHFLKRHEKATLDNEVHKLSNERNESRAGRPETSEVSYKDLPVVKFNEYKLNPLSSREYNRKKRLLMIWHSGKSWLYSERTESVIGVMDFNGQIFHKRFLGMFPEAVIAEMKQGHWDVVWENDWVRKVHFAASTRPKTRKSSLLAHVSPKELCKIGRPV